EKGPALELDGDAALGSAPAHAALEGPDLAAQLVEVDVADGRAHPRLGEVGRTPRSEGGHERHRRNGPHEGAAERIERPHNPAVAERALEAVAPRLATGS